MRECVYAGARLANGRTYVEVDGQPLPFDRRVSFDWGYTGSGPTALTRAILIHHCGAEPHRQIVERFRFITVSTWTSERWTLTTREVRTLLSAILDVWNIRCPFCADTGRRKTELHWTVCACQQPAVTSV